MSRRQAERSSRFRVEIEDSMRLAAANFRDNDVEASMTQKFDCGGRVVCAVGASRILSSKAREVTQAQISLGRVEQAGRST
jgi:hypothetical protein